MADTLLMLQLCISNKQLKAINVCIVLYGSVSGLCIDAEGFDFGWEIMFSDPKVQLVILLPNSCDSYAEHQETRASDCGMFQLLIDGTLSDFRKRVFRLRIGGESVLIYFNCSLQGSIFAVLESQDAAKAFVARDDVKQFKGNDMIVLIK